MRCLGADREGAISYGDEEEDRKTVTQEEGSKEEEGQAVDEEEIDQEEDRKEEGQALHEAEGFHQEEEEDRQEKEDEALPKTEDFHQEENCQEKGQTVNEAEEAISASDEIPLRGLPLISVLLIPANGIRCRCVTPAFVARRFSFPLPSAIPPSADA